MTATIVTLGNRNMPTPTSFEEAFGEFSEARGDRRKRRQARRMQRINDRKERRKARQEGRLDKKRARVEARTQRRSMRAENRESRRNMRSEGKRSRERADLEQEREFAPEEEPQSDGGASEQGGGYDDGGYAPQGGYAEEQGGGYAEEAGGYAEEGGDYAEEDGGYAEEGGYDEESEGFYGDYDDFDGDDTDDFDGDEENDGFDGESYEFDGSNEMIDAPYSAQVNEGVADAAQKIEWNLELASRLKEKQNQNPSAKISDAIDNCNARVVELKSQLDGYCNFEGEFVSDADGKMRFRRKMARRKRNLKQTPNVKRRGKEIREARRIARAKRNAIRMKQGLTPVKASLNPQMGTNKIVIPAKELGSNYTGLTGLDDAMAYDASATEIKLGVDGNKTSKIPFKAIAIGVAVGALGIFLLRKYKVI